MSRQALIIHSILLAFALCGVRSAKAQDIYAYSSLTLTANTASGASYMEINYEDAWVYSAFDDGYLIANGNIVQHDGEGGGSSASSSVSTSLSYNTDYVMQSNYWVEFDSFGNEGYWDPAGYSLIGGGYWGDSMDVYGSPDCNGSRSFPLRFSVYFPARGSR